MRTMEAGASIGQRIVHYRLLKGWKQKQLREALGMKQSRLSSLERGTRKPSFEEMDRIAFFLEQPLASFSMLRKAPQGQQPLGPLPGPLAQALDHRPQAGQ